MREEIKQELQRKIAEKFEQARGQAAPSVKQITEEERAAMTKRYADLLIKAALRKI